MERRPGVLQMQKIPEKNDFFSNIAQSCARNQNLSLQTKTAEEDITIDWQEMQKILYVVKICHAKNRKYQIMRKTPYTGDEIF